MPHIRGQLPLETCIALGREICDAVDATAWALGDLALHVETSYGGQELQRWTYAGGEAGGEGTGAWLGGCGTTGTATWTWTLRRARQSPNWFSKSL